MKDLIAVLWFPALIIALMFVFNPVKDCSKIPADQRCNYAVTSDNKCVKMSEREIEEIHTEELEEKVKDLEWENCELKKFATSECKQLKEDEELINKIMYVKQRGKVSNEKN